MTRTPIADPRAFGSGADTTCFYDLGQSWLGFEHPVFRLRGELPNPLRYSVTYNIFKTEKNPEIDVFVTSTNCI